MLVIIKINGNESKKVESAIKKAEWCAQGILTRTGHIWVMDDCDTGDVDCTENVLVMDTSEWGNPMEHGRIIKELAVRSKSRTTNVDVLITRNKLPKHALRCLASAIIYINADDSDSVSEQLEALHMLSGTLTDAARFNAICDKGIFRLIGSAGFSDSVYQRDEYKHFGCEMWTVGMEGSSYAQFETREHFTAYADTMITNQARGVDGRTTTQDGE